MAPEVITESPHSKAAAAYLYLRTRLLNTSNFKTAGTITHMAPEVITESLHSKAADVYSFGVVLWELLACAKPYSGLHYAQIVHAIAQHKVCVLVCVLLCVCV